MDAWGRIIVDELRLLKEQTGPETQKWKADLEPHIQEAYQSKGMTEFSWPLVKTLVRIVGYPPPHIAQLEHDFSEGFDLL